MQGRYFEHPAPKDCEHVEILPSNSQTSPLELALYLSFTMFEGSPGPVESPLAVFGAGLASILAPKSVTFPLSHRCTGGPYDSVCS